MPGHGFIHALRLDEFYEPELRGFVAVVLFCAALHHHARARLQHGASDQRAVCLEDLRHAQLDSDNSVDRHFPFLSFAACLALRILAASCSRSFRTKARPNYYYNFEPSTFNLFFSIAAA